MNTQKSSQITKDPQHRHLIRPPATFCPSDAEKGHPLEEGGVDLSAARRGIEQDTEGFRRVAETDGRGARATQPEPFINKPEVAHRLNKTLRTVDNWMKRGILVHYKVGRSVLFRWSEIEAHLAATCRVARRNRS